MRNVAVTEGDKTEAGRASASPSTWGVNELVAAVEAVDGLVGLLIRQATRTWPRHRPHPLHVAVATSTEVAAPARPEVALRTFLESVGAKAFDELRGPRRPAPGTGSPSSGSWPTATASAPRATGRPSSCARPRSWAKGLPGGASLMEDYTYDLTRRRAHPGPCSRSARRSPPRSRRSRSTRSASVKDPVRLVFDTDPGVGVVVSLADMRDRFASPPTSSTSCRRPPRSRTSRWPAPSGNYLTRTSARAWLTAGGARHAVLSTAVGIEVFEDFAEIARTEHRHRGDPRPAAASRAGPLEPDLLAARPGTVDPRSAAPHRAHRSRRRTGASRTGPTLVVGPVHGGAGGMPHPRRVVAEDPPRGVYGGREEDGR